MPSQSTPSKSRARTFGIVIGTVTSLSDQHHDGTRADGITILIDQYIFGAGLYDIVRGGLRRVHDTTPVVAREVRQCERALLPVRVGNEVDIVHSPCLEAVEMHSQGAGLPRPVRLA